MYGETAFFVWDTRKHRTPASEEDDEHKTMLGSEQKDAFYRWLSAVNSTSTFKFVSSSVPFMTLWGGALDVDSQQDSWAAYQTERKELMDVMQVSIKRVRKFRLFQIGSSLMNKWKNRETSLRLAPARRNVESQETLTSLPFPPFSQYVPNVIVLSGDRHEFAAAGIGSSESIKAGQHPVVEFSTSPLSMFWLPVKTLSQDNGLGETGEDKLYKYLPEGNIKWSEFTVDTRNPLSPVVNVRVVIDGEVAWKVKIVGKQVREPPQAIGGMAKSFLELLGFKKFKWF